MSASKRPWRSYDLRFEISNLNYPGIHVQIASNGLLGHFPGTGKSFFWEPEKSFPGNPGKSFPRNQKVVSRQPRSHFPGTWKSFSDVPNGPNGRSGLSSQNSPKLKSPAPKMHVPESLWQRGEQLSSIDQQMTSDWYPCASCL